MRSPLVAAVLVAVAVAASACAADAEDDHAESGDDAFTSGVPVHVRRELAPLNLDLSKEFRDAFDERGYGLTTTVTPRVRFALTQATIAGQVTPGRSEQRRPTILSADLSASAHYAASFEVALDASGIGSIAALSQHDREDWEERLVGGKPMVIAKDILPLDIPVAGPLFVHTHFDLAVACAVTDIDGHLHATTGAGLDGDLSFAIGYRRDHFPENDSRFRFSAGAPNFRTRHTPLSFVTSPARVKGRCSLQPSLVVLFERTIGAKLFVEPYVELEATYSSANGLDFGKVYGVEGHVETAVELFGHQLLRPKEFPLFDKRFE